MKLRNENFRIHEIRSGLPGVLRNRVALPLDKIKQMTTNKLGVEDFLHFEFMFVIDDDGRRGGCERPGISDSMYGSKREM